MKTLRWQKQHIHFQSIIWGVSAVISALLITLLLSLGFSLEVAGIWFILVFVVLRVSLAYLFTNWYANSMVRILNFNYEEIERDFRLLFKDKNIRFSKKTAEDVYRYEFAGHNLTMTVQPYWVQWEPTSRPLTKVTLYQLTATNEAFAEMLANAIDEMANQRAGKLAAA